MTADIGAAADTMTGALLARSFEPDAGEAHGGGGALCLNCGTRLIGEHCHACGQAGHVHRSLGAIAHEIGHGVFHFEGKIWRTLPMLVLHPGTLTRRYVQGERARFVSPLALFLFSVFLMFATISAVGGEMSELAQEAASNTSSAKTSAKLEAARAELARVEAQRARTKTGDLDTERAVLRTTIRGLETTSDQVGVFGSADLKTGWARLDHGLAKARSNPGLTVYKLQTSAYKYSWVLIPLSVPFVALLFLWRRRHHLYDHAIFVTYSLAFMMLLTITLMLARLAGLPSGWITFAAFMVPPIHMFAQLRGAYELRKRSAAWRTAVLLAFAFTALITFVVLLLLHGLTD
ncbi:DUF3667 domain-containing protein [Sphingomonas sp. R86521]|uniref:DUF3667 domain-containing protein n=1 Tax=Sphingomonas sp. R86521 TaxID=3093860 RepID=UPI0036D3F9E0